MKILNVLFSCAAAGALHAAETIALFNGKNLNGWHADVPAADGKENKNPSFIVRNGLLVSLGSPGGHLITDKEFSDYKLTVEYRFPDKPGNCGVLIHASDLRALYDMFPKSIEVQMQHGSAGDFWCIQENIEVPDMEKRRPRREGQKFGGAKEDARQILNLTDGSEKPPGEWNTMTIEARGDEIIVHVNGDLVNHGTNATATKGKIALQAEGSEVEFRKVELTPLEGASADRKTSSAKPFRIEHEIRQIEGWTVHVDASLLDGKHKETGDLALRVLGDRLHEISLRLPAEPVARMREVPIYLDRNHPLGNAHYHPDPGWLRDRGYDPAMGKAVQITGAASLIREARNPNSSSVMLHEFAHAYHDRVLGFDHPEILAAYKTFCDSRKFDNTEHISGRRHPHYGLTDHKEYFAEMTETYFIGNDYFPFNHYQLYHEHRPSYDLMTRIWGSEIKPPAEDAVRDPGVLSLRIQATLLAQRGEFNEALILVDNAEEHGGDNEGRLAELRKMIERERTKSTSAQ
jgi:hypothetical protein